MAATGRVFTRAQAHNTVTLPSHVNILTGLREELTGQFASHMDVNAVIYSDGTKKTARMVQELAADNIKRVISRAGINWMQASSQHPYLIRETQEVKTTWHPIGT